MFRTILLPLVLAFTVAVSGVSAQTKKAPAAPAKSPGPKDQMISINVFMRDTNKNELLLGTHIWPAYPEYNAAALQRFFALMKALEPPYKQDDEVAYSWSTKAKVTKCSIYLESWEAGAKNSTGATVGCEANGVSSLIVTSEKDSTKPSASSDPRHLEEVMDLFKKQQERAKNNVK
jgi:hypothetical protein